MTRSGDVGISVLQYSPADLRIWHIRGLDRFSIAVGRIPTGGRGISIGGGGIAIGGRTIEIDGGGFAIGSDLFSGGRPRRGAVPINIQSGGCSS